MSPRTKNNLMTAMQSDAFDAAKYSRFAARARMDDELGLAKVFQESAESERTEHFATEAKLDGLIAKGPDNVRSAIDAEMKEIKMFTEFAREASEDGDIGIAAVFERFRRDKAERCARLEAVLRQRGANRSI